MKTVIIKGFYIEQDYSSVQYKFRLIDKEDVSDLVTKILDSDLIRSNDIPSDLITTIIDECMVVSDNIPSELYRWEMYFE